MHHPKVAIIILNWNGKEDTIECLESLHEITYPNYQILLVDNGSTDGSVKCFMERYPEIEIVENGKNLGFAEGNNVGIRRALERGVDYVLLLNNDTIVKPDFLDEMIELGKNDHSVGIIGPTVYNFNDLKNPNAVGCIGFRFNFWLGGNPINVKDSSKSQKIDMLSGCCMLIKTEVLKRVGLLDTIYFFGWEDADFCFKVRNFGYKITPAKKGIIWHKIGASYGGYYADNPNVLTNGIKNQLIFIDRYANVFQKIIFIIYFISFYFGIILYSKQKKNIPIEKIIAIKNGIKQYMSFKMYGKNN